VSRKKRRRNSNKVCDDGSGEKKRGGGELVIALAPGVKHKGVKREVEGGGVIIHVM